VGGESHGPSQCGGEPGTVGPGPFDPESDQPIRAETVEHHGDVLILVGLDTDHIIASQFYLLVTTVGLLDRY
jgi:hypothetical protein